MKVLKYVRNVHIPYEYLVQVGYGFKYSPDWI